MTREGHICLDPKTSVGSRGGHRQGCLKITHTHTQLWDLHQMGKTVAAPDPPEPSLVPTVWSQNRPKQEGSAQVPPASVNHLGS